MGNFNRSNDRGGFRPGGDRGGFRPRDREITMHKAICSNCNQSCEVPFRPTGEKPVYCNNCFGKMRDAEGGGRGRDDRQPRRDFGGGAPRNDFGGAPPRQNFESNKSNGNADVVHQLEVLNAKLDRILRAIEKPVQSIAPQIVKPGTLKQAVKRATDSKKKK
ncbi:MAG: hypothetical protein Q7S12_00735 [bacterium]|nr:hypothetical protein [bacterium]